MTNYLLNYDLPLHTPTERYTNIRERLEAIGAIKVAYSTFHVSYEGDLELYLSPVFTSEDRVIIAPYNPYATKMQSGGGPLDGGTPPPYQAISFSGLGSLSFFAGLFEPTPPPLNAFANYPTYANALLPPKPWEPWK